MEISIHSYDWNIGYKGKTTRAAPSNFDVSVEGATLILKGKDSEWRGTGERGGAFKDIQRNVSIGFSQQDLKTILSAALAAGLLEASFAIPKGRRKKERKD